MSSFLFSQTFREDISCSPHPVSDPFSVTCRLLLVLSALLIVFPPCPAFGQDDDGVRVSVLGYHVFSAAGPATAMTIPTPKFRDQMRQLKASGVPFISLDQFLRWRRGEASLPARSYLLTIDDGWESVYTEAWPILKDLEIPFVIYLYRNYVGKERGGRALSRAAIREMMESGLCALGSHSVSHPRPSEVRRMSRAPREDYLSFLRTELADSKSFLEEEFGQRISTYAYPGGFHTPEMFTLADEIGYDHLFTVIDGKVRRDSPRHQLPRYIILGNHNSAFQAAQTFRNPLRPPAGLLGSEDQGRELPHPVSPGPGHLIAERLPLISADLSNVKDLDPASLRMSVSGFGPVPFSFDPETRQVSWRVIRPLRLASCEVLLDWSSDSTDHQPLRWSFLIDHSASYQPKKEFLQPWQPHTSID